MEEAMSDQKLCLFYPAYYEDGNVYLKEYASDFDGGFLYPEPVMSTVEEAPAWVRKRVAMINLLEPYEETPFGEWQHGAWDTSDVTDDTPIYRSYFIIVNERTAKTWGKGWKKEGDR